MYKIGNSKAPLFHQLGRMAWNLRNKLDKTAYVEVEAVFHRSGRVIKHSFKISLVPGFGERCSIWYTGTWKETLDIYTKLIKGEISSGR